MVHPWMQGTVIVEAEAAHGDDHAEEMEEMGHGDDHAAKGIEDLSRPVYSLSYIRCNSSHWCKR